MAEMTPGGVAALAVAFVVVLVVGLAIGYVVGTGAELVSFTMTNSTISLGADGTTNTTGAG